MIRFLALILCFMSFPALADDPVIKTPDGHIHGLGLKHLPKALKGLGELQVELADCSPPANFDLRDLGVVPSVRDQGQCGSCWAHSQTASLESSVKVNGGTMLDLSEEELVSCDKQNWGCSGGLLNDNGYQISHGEGLEKDFPYRAADLACKQVPSAAKGISWVHLKQDQKQLQCALFTSHTIPWVTVAADNDWGSFPSSLSPVTSCGNTQIDHAVGIVGWKTIGTKVYFIMRNSWGPGWGAAGYALMPLGCSMLGDELAYIQTKVAPCVPPKPLLPIEILAHAGDALELAVKKEDGAKYSWVKDGKTIGTGGQVAITADLADTIYTLRASNSCGKAETATRVKVAAPTTN